MMDSSRISVGIVAAVMLLPVAACGGGGSDDEGDAPAKAVDGTFVGKVAGTKAYVAVVAAPVVGKQTKRDVSVYVSDGRRLTEWFSASAAANSFEAGSEDGDAQVKGTLSGRAVTGTLELPGGKATKYHASPATGAAGLYELSVSRDGELSGASAAGIGLKGETPLEEGTGTLKLADGKRRKFAVTGIAGDVPGLRAGQARLIVLDDGLTGAGKPRSAKGDPAFLIRSAG
jgi:hypothetical protein